MSLRCELSHHSTVLTSIRCCERVVVFDSLHETPTHKVAFDKEGSAYIDVDCASLPLTHAYICSPKSTKRASTKAMYKLWKPAEQIPDGMEEPLSYPLAADSPHSCPPLLHSQIIFPC